jgi:predicted molibdopterin-dependent oxidoreductase YjgC
VDRVNRGRLGPKGLNGWMANNSPDRLTHPLIRRGDGFEPASWDEAMELIGDRTREIQDKYTGQAIGFYNSGQLFLEEYYTLSIMDDAGVGTYHMDGNTRLCTATAALGKVIRRMRTGSLIQQITVQPKEPSKAGKI